MKKLVIALVWSALMWWACGEGGNSEADALAGEGVFKQYCVACHGVDGKLGINNSKDLTASVMPLKDRIEQITNGKAGTAMTPFKSILTEDQIRQVAVYTMGFSAQ